MRDITVVITTYNVEHYIERAVASALAQQGVTVEIVIVDDCSTDNTWSAILDMTNSSIRPIRLEKNGGPGAARNAGFAAANAPWIAVLDGDDAMEPDRLRRMLARARNMNADIVVDNVIVQHGQDGMQYPMFAPQAFSRLGTMTLSAFINGNCFFVGERAYGYLKPMFCAEFLRLHGLLYNTDTRIGEDYILLAEALACGAVCAVEGTPGYRYTVRTGSLSRHAKLADIERLIACDRVFSERYNLSSDARRALQRRERSLIDGYHFHHLIEALKTRNIGFALKFLTAHPLVARHLWRPVWSRTKRAFAHGWSGGAPKS